LKSDSNPFYALINCAGAGYFAPVENLPIEEWNKLLRLNLTAPFLLTQFVLPEMKKQRAGRIINLSSDADNEGFANSTAYCASKFALRGFGDALRKEIAGSSITVTTISPGRVDTCFNGKSPGMRPLSLSANDVAAVVVMLLATDTRCAIELVRMKSNLE
jgi:short-subunit dehydrogenase